MAFAPAQHGAHGTRYAAGATGFGPKISVSAYSTKPKLDTVTV
jgi:hypothetical protein